MITPAPREKLSFTLNDRAPVKPTVSILVSTAKSRPFQFGSQVLRMPMGTTWPRPKANRSFIGMIMKPVGNHALKPACPPSLVGMGVLPGPVNGSKG